jgi:hypothetical protein
LIIKKATTRVLKISQNAEWPTKKLTGESQPPKKQIAIITDNQSILLYSARKNKAKVMAEYSTLKPATNSASASGKSKGARLVSANIEIKNTTHVGNNGKKNHVLSFC